LLCRQEDFAPLTDEPWDVGRVCGGSRESSPTWTRHSAGSRCGRRRPIPRSNRAGVSRRFTLLATFARTGDEL
jgi:hypothetical protein